MSTCVIASCTLRIHRQLALMVGIASCAFACGTGSDPDRGSGGSVVATGGAISSGAGGASGSSIAATGGANPGGASGNGGHATGSGGGATGGASTGGGGGVSIGGWAGASFDDGCSDELAQGITISEIAVFQAGKIPVMQNGTAVAPRTAQGAEIIQGKDSLFRVYVTVDGDFQPRELSARLQLNGRSLSYHERTTIAGSSRELDADDSFNLAVPGTAITSSLDYRLEIVECGAGSGTAHNPVFPASGVAPLATRRTGVVRITMLPVTSGGVTPTLDQTFANEIKAAAESMYPTAGIEITLDDTPTGDCNITSATAADGDAWGECGDILRSRRENDQPPADVYYVGVLKPEPTYEEYCPEECYNGYSLIGGVDEPSFRAAVLTAYLPHVAEVTFPHELGHSHGLYHAAGCGAGTPDPSYPYIADGTSHIGWVGWDERRPAIEFLDPERFPEFMSYCSETWISDYTYKRIADRIAGIAGARVVPGPVGTWRVLLETAKALHWGVPITTPRPAEGEATRAAVLDADGDVISQVTVYRVPSSLGGAVYMVPEPEAGWTAIAINGHLLAF
jgi:hypothetical protein